MKITFVGTIHPYRGGISVFNERLSKQLVQENHDVEFKTFTLQYPSFLFPGTTQFSTAPPPDNLNITRCINSINPITWINTGNNISRSKPDILVFCYWMSFMAPCFTTIAKRVSKNNHTKIISLLHNFKPHEPSILDKIFPKYFVNQVEGFLSLSKSVLEDVSDVDRKNKPKVYSPHPIYDHYGDIIPKETAKKLINLDPKTNYLLFFGFIRHYKGLDLLFEAFALNKSKFQELNIKLIVAGEFYEDKNKYLDIINKYKLEDSIVLRTDFIPDPEVASYFCAADLVVQPYRSATQSGVTQIAYHFEKPMLVTNVGGLAEIIPHNKVGYVVETEPEDISKSILDFYINNRNLQMIENIKIEKKKFAWDKLSESLLLLAEQIKK